MILEKESQSKNQAFAASKRKQKQQMIVTKQHKICEASIEQWHRMRRLSCMYASKKFRFFLLYSYGCSATSIHIWTNARHIWNLNIANATERQQRWRRQKVDYSSNDFERWRLHWQQNSSQKCEAIAVRYDLMCVHEYLSGLLLELLCFFLPISMFNLK